MQALAESKKCSDRKTSGNARWCVLLTAAVTIHPQWRTGRNTPEQRKALYLKSIGHWLEKTNFEVFVVESSGYGFPEFQHERFHVYSFMLAPERTGCSSSQLDAECILVAIENFRHQMKTFTHVLKVTGRYFFQDIQNTLANLPQDLDIYLQHSCNPAIDWQNSELFGFRKTLAEEIFTPILQVGFMEQRLYAVGKQYARQYRFPPVRNTFMVARGGDGLTIQDL